MKIDHSARSEIALTPRVKQLAGMFDVPLADKLSHDWHGDVPIEARDWNVGLIVGPSGAGKTSLARKMFGDFPTFAWRARSVIDDFPADRSIEEISRVCSSVGFNTIPSWMKPFGVLSNGEQFRVSLARHLVETGDPIVVDEFTSVVDRQVAKIGANAVQKHVRRQQRKFVAVSCHYDILDWLQPDWVLEPATMDFHWRELQRRPALGVEIARVDFSAWRLFAPFHYLTADLHPHAACYTLFVEGVPASFAAVLHRPHPKSHDIKGVSRLVTLPDYQGLGLAMILVDRLGSLYRAAGYRLHTYPAHPALVRAFDKSRMWAMVKRPGVFSPAVGRTSTMVNDKGKLRVGGRPCGVFVYAGPSGDRAEAGNMGVG